MLKWIGAPILAMAIAAQSLIWYAERPVTASDGLSMPNSSFKHPNRKPFPDRSARIHNLVYIPQLLAGLDPKSYIYPEERKYILRDASCRDRLYDLIMNDNFPKEPESVFPELNLAIDVYPECVFCFAEMYSSDYPSNLYDLCNK